jgi:hypothetical protein
MVASDDACSDMAAVKAANPLWSITEETLREDFASPTMDLGDWKRLKCNRPTRAVTSAITDKEWDDAQVEEEIPAGAGVDVGVDIAFKWDTTALVPLWDPSPAERPGLSGGGPRFRLLGPATVLVPPRDGSSMHPDVIKDAAMELVSAYNVRTFVMDMERAADIASWIEDELGIMVIDRGQSNKHAVADYNAFMDGLRNGTLKHTGCAALRSHVLHAIARKLPGGDYRFDRPSTVRQNVRAQDRRVIDALSAAGFVVEHSNRAPATRSVYEDRYTAA